MITVNKIMVHLAVAMMGIFHTHGQNAYQAKDFLTVPGPVDFYSQSFNLAWSSHPSATYYKQEYLLKTEVAAKYKTMLMLEAVADIQDLKNVVGAKVEELKKMKEANPMVNYDMIQNPKTGEYILDFLLTANQPNGDISIIERNVYRYSLFTDKNGKKGIRLFAVSTRGYAPGIDAFLAGLKTNKKDLVNKVAQFKIPDIILKP